MGDNRARSKYYRKIIKYVNFRLILISILLTSCAAPIYFEKTEPPEILTYINPCRIALVNIFNYTMPQAVKAENQNVYRNAINKFGLELSKIGITDSIYKFFFADSLFKGIDPENQSVILPADTIRQLSSAYGADYLLTLDSLNFYLEEDEPDESDESGIQVVLNNYYIIGNFFLSLYTDSGDLLNRSEVTMTTKFATKIGLTYFSGIAPSFSRAVVQGGELGVSAADDYADRFYPVRTQEQRYVYTGGKLKQANDLMVKEQWDKALEILNRLASGPKQSLSQKAIHNLSVLKEIRDAVEDTLKATGK
jgi:Family of unknown function (DUF6340)